MTEPRVAAYLRVSRAEQADEGHGLDVQRSRLTAYCTFQGWSRIEWHSDPGVSGLKVERPGLGRLLDSLGRTDVVLVYSLSRLARSVRGMLEIVARIDAAGVRFVSATENFDTATPVGRAVRNILATMWELELETTKERTMGGRAEAAKKGIWPAGQAPLGLARGEDGRLEITPDAETIRLIFDLARDRSLESLAEELARLGVRTAGGAAWERGHLSKLIANPAYKGEAVFGRRQNPRDRKRWVPVAAPAIVPVEAWEAAQRENRAREYARPDLYPLTGHVRCGACGGPLVGTTTRRAGQEWAYYVCVSGRHRDGRNARACRVGKSHRAPALVRAARGALADALADPVTVARLYAPARSAADPADGERRSLMLQLETLLDMRQHGELSREQLVERRAPVDARLRRLERPERPSVPASALAAARDLAPLVLALEGRELADTLDDLRVRFVVELDSSVRLDSLSVPTP